MLIEWGVFQRRDAEGAKPQRVQGRFAQPRKPLPRWAAVGGLRAGDCAGPCKHGHRHLPALAMRCIAAAPSGHGNGLCPTLNPTEKGLKGVLRPSVRQPLGISVNFRVPRSGLPCRLAAMQRIAEAWPRADACLHANPPTARRARAQPRAANRFSVRAKRYPPLRPLR